MKKFFVVMGFIVLALVGVGLVGFYYVPTHMAKEAVKLKLKDPDSAQFRNVRTVRVGLVCGEVNAKNSMGGYVGYTAFSVNNYDLLWSDSTMYVTLAQESTPFMPEVNRRLAALDTESVKGDCARP